MVIAILKAVPVMAPLLKFPYHFKIVNTAQKNIKVALADDHVLLRTALASLIDNFEDCSVVIQASNGNELIIQLQKGLTPDIILLDLNMPAMDGIEAAKWLQQNYPAIHILMLTMYDSELALIRLLQAG